MNSKTLIWVGLFIGSTVGGLLPSLWGADAFSLSGLFGSTIGGIVGTWIGYKLSV